MTKKTKVAAKTAAQTKPAGAAVATQMAAALTGPTEDQKKALAASVRASRYPKAAAAEAAKAAAKATGEKPPKAVKEAKPKAEKPAKPVEPTVEFVKRSLGKGKTVTVIGQAARPTSGNRLFAHTHAALSILGMLDASCPKVPASTVRTIMGDRAIAWHTKERNFVAGPDHTLSLSVEGRNKFTSRPVDGKLANAFVDMFLDGKVDEGTLGVKKGEVYQVGL